MFGRFAKPMTEGSDHFLDWSRTAELLLSTTHRYSRDELLARGFIVACIAASAYLGATQNNEEKTHCSSTAAAILLGFVGFVVSHAIVLIPLVQKRREMSAECHQLAEQIKQQVSTDACSADVLNLVNHILKLSLSTEQHGNASLTWGTRKRLLQCVKNRLDEGQKDLSFWQGRFADVLERVQQISSVLRPR